MFTKWFQQRGRSRGTKATTVNSKYVRTISPAPYRRPRTLATAEKISDRQERIAGFEQDCLSDAHVALIGAGMNGEVAEGLVRKGVGTLTIVDLDTISWTNLNRQLFFPNQVGEEKAHALAENLAPHTTAGTVIHSVALPLDAALDSGLLNLAEVDVLVVAVDNTAARIEASKAAQDTCPAVFAAVDLAGEAAYVAVQKPGEACFGCIVPQGLTPRKIPCAAPSVKDTAKFAGGAVLFAIDTILMPGRKRHWNYHEFHLAGVVPSWARTFPKSPACPLCGVTK